MPSWISLDVICPDFVRPLMPRAYLKHGCAVAVRSKGATPTVSFGAAVADIPVGVVVEKKSSACLALARISSMRRSTATIFCTIVVVYATMRSS